MKFSTGVVCGLASGVVLTSYTTLHIISRDEDLREGLVNAISTKLSKVLYGSNYKPRRRRGGDYIDYRSYQSPVRAENN
jgi:hypothetical protein